MTRPNCTTMGCNRPRVSQATNDALSVLGLTSEHCDLCTNRLLRALLAQNDDDSRNKFSAQPERTKQVA